MGVKKKCITITDDQDSQVRALQIQKMVSTKKNVSYSSILQEAIDEGLKIIMSRFQQ